MNLKKTAVVTLTASALLIGGFASAQANTNTPNARPPMLRRQGHLPLGFGGAMGGRGMVGGLHGVGLPMGGLSLGSTVTVNLYDADPEADGTVLETLTLVVGQDSEAAFMQALAEARGDAAFVVVNVSEQSRTVELAAAPAGRRGVRMLGLTGRDGMNVTATFFDADPAAGGNALTTLSFIHGESSALGFADAFDTAAAEAAFVTITTSPQPRTVDLSAVAERAEGLRERMGERGNLLRGFGSRRFR